MEYESDGVGLARIFCRWNFLHVPFGLATLNGQDFPRGRTIKEGQFFREVYLSILEFPS